MDKISSVGQIIQFTNDIRCLRKGYLTNFFLDEKKHSLWINHGELYSIKYGECVLLFRNTESVNYMFFLSSTGDALLEGLKEILPLIRAKLIVDLVGDERNQSLTQIFTSNGFIQYEKLYRMNRVGTPLFIEQKDERVTFASQNEARIVYDLLVTHFNPISEQIPCYEEIEYLAEAQHILIAKHNESIVGFLIFELNGVTLYLRYWFVIPGYRDLKVGSALFNEFLRAGKNTKRQLLWVIEKNSNAIKRYEHYGFKKENLYDYVLLKTL